MGEEPEDQFLSTKADTEGTCPHCGTTVCFVHLTDVRRHHVQPVWVYEPTRVADAEGISLVHFSRCPACKGPTIQMVRGHEHETHHLNNPDVRFEEVQQLWPKFAVRPVPSEVPAHVAKDFREACQTLSLSPNASAALSRRCLQLLLREQGHTQHNLVDQITAALPLLPSYLRNIDHVREIGNFAAHANKDGLTGDVIDVELEDAEWLLDLLEQCFTHYFVEPALQAERERKLAAMKARKRATPPPP